MQQRVSYMQSVASIFPLRVCKYPHISVSFALSLSKRGKGTHPATLAAASDTPPFFPLRKFPICLCAGLAERPWRLLKQQPMHTLIGKYADAWKVLQTQSSKYIVCVCIYLYNLLKSPTNWTPLSRWAKIYCSYLREFIPSLSVSLINLFSVSQLSLPQKHCSNS